MNFGTSQWSLFPHQPTYTYLTIHIYSNVLYFTFKVFPSDPAVVLDQIHGLANPLCCALSADDTLLATGGADAHLNICQWGAALAPTPGAMDRVVQSAIQIPCPAPVICVAFTQHGRGKTLPIVAAG